MNFKVLSLPGHCMDSEEPEWVPPSGVRGGNCSSPDFWIISPSYQHHIPTQQGKPGSPSICARISQQCSLPSAQQVPPSSPAIRALLWNFKCGTEMKSTNEPKGSLCTPEAFPGPAGGFGFLLCCDEFWESGRCWCVLVRGDKELSWSPPCSEVCALYPSFSALLPFFPFSSTPGAHQGFEALSDLSIPIQTT